ncbi:Fic family protein [Kineobactrum sediminis]|nr:Fic family protein [Kineobactrum sediminis]
MRQEEADKKAASGEIIDRGEPIGSMEPVKLSDGARQRGELADLAMDLAQASAAFRHSLPDQIVRSLADLVRAMNCYYSNLIEGHDTHPVDIERALKNDYSEDANKRNLQLEARAHIAVQTWIDEGGLDGGLAFTVDGACETHRRFCELLPPELLIITDPDTGEELDIVPGKIRIRDVKVGRHTPVSPAAVPRFLQRFEEVFTGLGKAEMVIATGAIHHRFAWIHPFLDGNGRVTRLMSHAILRETLDTGSIWSVSRGLARTVSEYKQKLSNCDLPRRNDLDGRGTLSEEALADFTKYFLETCLDQVRFMEKLVAPGRLRERILQWTANETQAGRLLDRSIKIIEALLYRGELPRSELPGLLGVTDRQARRVVSALMDRGVIVSETTKTPLRLAFPATLAHEWMPGLFPEKTE